MRRTLVFALALVLAAVPHARAGAQERGRVPPRTLPPAADTNHAQAYYTRGMLLLNSRPAEAADAFYWATRLEPGWAEAWYARRTAMLMAQPQLVGIHLKPKRSERDARALRETDSLYLRALALDPFLAPRLDKRALHAQLREMAPRELRATEDPETLDLMAELVMLQSGPELRAWNDFAKERYPQALAAYAEALPEARNRSGIHAERARIFFLTDRPDSALAEMRSALGQWGAGSGAEVLFRVDSPALLEHSTGVILERMGDREGAREAHGRALREDASYHPAHAALASLALAAGDTAAALREMEQAVRAAGSDPVVRYRFAGMLARAGRFPEAEAELREAVRLEPLFAPSYALLGGVLEKQGHAAPALEQYRAFLEHASRDHELATAIRERISVLGGGAAPTGS